MPSKCSEILNFWFGQNFRHGLPDKSQQARWFSSDPQLDDMIRNRFCEDIEIAVHGSYSHWCSEPTGRLAIIILLDQFSRNIYRGTAQAFAYDEQATELVLEGLDLGHDQQLIAAHRIFFYMPLEHSESLSHQKRCLALFERMYKECDPAIAATMKSNLAYAQQHLDIIERFGRFPHRNAALGRVSTPQELAYLQLTNNDFGQTAK